MALFPNDQKCNRYAVDYRNDLVETGHFANAWFPHFPCTIQHRLTGYCNSVRVVDVFVDDQRHPHKMIPLILFEGFWGRDRSSSALIDYFGIRFR